MKILDKLTKKKIKKSAQIKLLKAPITSVEYILNYSKNIKTEKC